jgi:hypothetical protein
MQGKALCYSNPNNLSYAKELQNTMVLITKSALCCFAILYLIRLSP